MWKSNKRQQRIDTSSRQGKAALEVKASILDKYFGILHAADAACYYRTVRSVLSSCENSLQTTSCFRLLLPLASKA